MLKKRIITAVIGLPAILLLLIFGPQWLLIPLFLIFVGLGSFEAAQLLLPRLSTMLAALPSDEAKEKSTDIAWRYVVVVMSLLIFLASSAGKYHAARGTVIVGLMAVMVLGGLTARSIEYAIGRSATLVFAVCYGALPWLAIWDLYLMSDGGARYVVFLLAIAWGGDTAAYFAGTAWGKNKLAPKISPNKTWEGSIAGIFASVIIGILINLLYSGAEKPLGGAEVVFVAGLLGGIFAQIGDLVESALKRFAQVKDSGEVFPGHGGFLDRVDSLFFSAPVIWLIFYAFG